MMTAPSQVPSRYTGRPSDPRRRAWRAILEFHGTLTTILDAEMREVTPLDLQTYDALLHAYEAGENGIRMTDLAQKVILSKSGLTAAVDRLEQRTLLKRVPDPTDRRATRIILTPEGIDAFLAAAEVHVAGIKRHFSARVSKAEATIIADVLQRVRGEAVQSEAPSPAGSGTL